MEGGDYVPFLFFCAAGQTAVELTDGKGGEGRVLTRRRYSSAGERGLAIRGRPVSSAVF